MASNDYKISEAACELLLDKTGASMELIRNEIDKLISYCSDKRWLCRRMLRRYVQHRL